jgi:hypothetical protein
MCHRSLTLADRAVLLDGDDPEVVWTWDEQATGGDIARSEPPRRAPVGKQNSHIHSSEHEGGDGG